MTNLILPSRRIVQPQQPTRIAADFAENLWVAYTAPVLGARSSKNAKPVIGVADSGRYSNSLAKSGRSLYGDGTSAASAKGAYGSVGDLPFHNASAMSMFAVVELSSLAATNETAVFRAAGLGSGIAFGLLPSTRMLRPLIRTSGSTGWSASYDENDNTIAVNIPWGFGLSYVSGQRVVYSGPIGAVPKVFTRTNITGSITSDTGTNYAPYYGGMEYSTGSTAAFPGHILQVYIAGKVLSEGTFKNLFVNPWQIFAPQPRKLWVVPASGGVIDLASDAYSVATATGSIDITSALTGAGIALATADGVVNQSVALSGAAASAAIADGIATITVSLSGDGFIDSFASGAITGAMALEGAGTAASAASAGLDSNIDLAGNAAATSTAVGGINLTTTLSGTALSQALATANLDQGGSGLSGDAQATATAQGAIFSSVPLTAAATVVATGSGGLTSDVPISGAAVSVATGTGDLTVGVGGLTGTALAEALAGGNIKMSLSLSASALSQAVAAALLIVPGSYSLPDGVYGIKSVTPRYGIKSRTPVHRIRSLTHAQ